ncbi:MAG: DUF4124 domain-containing protein [Thiolinea sp.]
MKPNFHYLVLTFALLFLTFAAHADIYKWTDADGKTHYSQTPPEDKKTKVEDIGDEIGMAAGTAGTATTETAAEDKPAEDEMAEARKQGEENAIKHNDFCMQQKAALKQLLSNPVIRWKSKDEKEERILTAKEREAKIAEFEQNIKKLCNAEVLPDTKVTDVN